MGDDAGVFVEARLLTDADLAERWNCARGHLANLRCAKAGPPYVKLGAMVRYRLADVVTFEESGIVLTDDSRTITHHDRNGKVRL
jgi:hypothetical protein